MSSSGTVEFYTLLVLAGTLVATFWQLRTQNKLLKAQLLRDRFEMYWRMFEPLPEGHEEWLAAFPDDYMDPDLYRSRYQNRDAQRRYIGMSQVYEYLAFSHGMEGLGLLDPLGKQWLPEWLSSLVGHQEFLDVHEYYKRSYPGFAEVVEKARRQSSRSSK